MILLALFAFSAGNLLFTYASVTYGAGPRAEIACGGGFDSARGPAVSYRELPLSLVCEGNEGGAVEMVPFWVNPMLLLLFLVALAAGLAALRRAPT